MGKYDEKLNSLFEKWIKASEKRENDEKRDAKNQIIFTYDGLMYKPDPSIDVEEDWEKEKIRVMFLLKDQPSNDTNDARTWLKDLPEDKEHNKKQKDKNRNLHSRFIQNIANLFYGIYHSRVGNVVSFDSLNHEEVKSTFLTKPFAFVECKKQGGTTSISDPKLKYYLNHKDYKPLLEEEIRLLNPNVIVCTNKHIYSFVINLFGGDEAFLKIPGKNSIRVRPEKEGVSKLIILCSYHPSAFKSYVTIFEGVMDHYRTFLHSDIAFDL